MSACAKRKRLRDQGDRAVIELSGKQAIVTGAGSGIGAALTRALVAAGAEVACTDVDAEAARRTAVDTNGPGTARAARVDVTDAGAVQAAVDDVVARAGRLDLMFNNAGIVWAGDTELLTLDQWNAIIDVNIRGPYGGGWLSGLRQISCNACLPA